MCCINRGRDIEPAAARPTLLHNVVVSKSSPRIVSGRVHNNRDAQQYSQLENSSPGKADIFFPRCYFMIIAVAKYQYAWKLSKSRPVSAASTGLSAISSNPRCLPCAQLSMHASCVVLRQPFEAVIVTATTLIRHVSVHDTRFPRGSSRHRSIILLCSTSTAAVCCVL